jgi:hypothetical protein
MRKLHLILIIALILVIGTCHKNEPAGPQPERNSFYGDFYIIKTDGTSPPSVKYLISMNIGPNLINYDYGFGHPGGYLCEAKVPFEKIAPDTISLLPDGATYSSGCISEYYLEGRFHFRKTVDSLYMDQTDPDRKLIFRLNLKLQ